MSTLYFVSHTHWDREWYEPFQVFRLRLVKCIDKLLTIFATDPEYKYFLLDGQTIILEDYLEMRPDREQALRELIRIGRLHVGPWYILPDEFLVSGEAIIRNLQRGIRIGNRFGGTMPIGYIPDPFGHIGQMPQILRGFGFKTAVFRRGLADEPTELWWQAPDGTRVLVCYLRDSYDNAAWLPRDTSGFVDGVNKLRDSLAPHAVTDNFLLMNGTDHMEPYPDLSRLMRAAQEQITDARLIHASLPMYVEQVQNKIAQTKKELQVARGELRNPKRHHLLPGVTSMRMWIKQRNAQAQMLLEKWAEPFAAFAALEVGRWTVEELIQRPTSNDQPLTSKIQLLGLAWKYLLQNQPHDSICGCSADETHADMIPRFNWVEQISNSIIDESLVTLASQIDMASMGNVIPVVVFNPVAGPRTDTAKAIIELTGNFEDFALVDDAGDEIAFNISAHSLTRSEIQFIARDVPGHGYTTFQVARRTSQVATASSINHRLSIENEFYEVEPNRDDGTVTVSDKSTGAIYRGANRFVSGGDRGDLYNYCPPENDLLIAQPSTPPQIDIERNAARQSIRIAMNYHLPGRLTKDRSARTQESVDRGAKIVTTILLYPGVHRIDFRTQVDNRACDHRLRVEFPSSIVTVYANADQAFDVVTRSLILPTDTTDWIEQPRPEAPMQNFVSISDNKVGLMLAARGLLEYEARKDTGGITLALTLLRCVGWLSRDDLSTRRGHAGPAKETPGAQEIGAHVFEYALIPHAGNWQSTFAEAFAFCAPMRAIVTDIHPGTLPMTNSLVQTWPREFVISAIKLPEEGSGLIVRGYNIGDGPIDIHIVLWRKFQRAMRVNPNEMEIAEIDLFDGHEVRLRVRGKEIVTLRFE